MLSMTEKKARPEKARKKKNYHVQVDISDEVGAAFDRFLATHIPTTKKGAAIEAALLKYLGDLGYWPPPPKPLE